MFSTGTLTQDIVAGVTINQLFMSGGTLILANPLTLEVGLQFTGGSITSGTLNVAGSSTQSALMTVSNTIINNSGSYTVTLSSGNVFSGSGSVFNNSGTLTAELGAGTVTFNIPLNNSGTLAVSSGTLRLTSPGTLGGILDVSAGGILALTNGFTLSDGTEISGAGNVQLDNNTTTTLVGTLINNGTISFANVGTGIDLSLNGDVTLSGTGSILLNNFGNNRIFANTVGGLLLIGSGQTIQGSGNLGVGQTTFSNDGIIIATQSNALVIQPGGGSADFTNNFDGILRADGGTLQLSGANGGVFNNNGTIEALNGSQVQLINGVGIVGGTFATADGGTINSLGSTLTNVTNSGALVLNNNTITTLVGTLTNNGTLTFANVGTGTDVHLSGSVTLVGTGTVTLNNFSNNRIFANTAGDRLTIGSGLTIQGSGNLGVGVTTFTNNGLIIATQSNPLVIQPGGGMADFINSESGILRADGGTLQLSGASGGIFTNNGTIEALGGSQVQLTNGVSIVGGTLATTGSSIHSLGSSLTDVTNNGDLILDNNTTTTLVDIFTNNGTLTFANVGTGVNLILSGSVSLLGNGTITLNNFGNNLIFASTAGDRLTIGSGVTIQGSGNLGNGSTTFTNNGTIIANQSNALVIQPGGGSKDFLNAAGATLRATNGAVLRLSGASGGTFTNNSVVEALDGSVVEFKDGVIVTGNSTFSTVGTGVISVVNTATLDNLIFTGNLTLANNTTTTLVGSLTDNGTLNFANVGTGINLVLSGSISLLGNGTISLNNFGNNLIFASTAGDLLTVGSGLTIQGSGNLGNGSTTFTNNGTIIANQSNPLVIQPGGGSKDFLNSATGVLRANGGTLQLSGASGGVFTNNGTIEALGGSQVQLTNGVSIVGGTLATTGSSIHSLGSSLTDVTNNGDLVLNNNTVTTLVGSLINNGTVTYANVGTGTDLVLSGNVTLSGSGLVTLNNFGNNRLFASTSGNRLTIASGQTIQGAGNLGIGQTTFTNNGTIIANQSNPLVLQPGGGTADFTNGAGGILQAAAGATLRLDGISGGKFINNNTVQALDGSVVEFTNGAVVSGNGLFSTVGTGLIRVATTATLDNLSFTGNLTLANNTTTTLVGTLTNNGTLAFANVGTGTNLTLNGDVTLAGTGTVTLNNFSNNLIFANTSGDRLTIGSGQTIQGSGNLGIGQTTFSNNGTIIANQSNALVLQPGGGSGDFTNNAGGILRANGGNLQLSGASSGTFSNNGTIEALDASQVQLTNNAQVSGGIFTTSGSGTINSLNAGLTNLTNNGAFVLNNNTTTTLAGTITNNGTFTFGNVGTGVDLTLNGNVTLAGSGTVTLNNFSNNRIFASPAGSRLTIGNAQTIQGSGNLGIGQTAFTNNGTVIANQSNALVIQPATGSSFTNNGTLRANGATLQLSGSSGSTFANSGTIETVGAGTLQFTGAVTSSNLVDVGTGTLSVTGGGSYTQSAGTFRLADGTVTSSTALNFIGGLVDARGTINSALTNSANLQPALVGAGLIVNGAVSLLSSSQLTFQLGGLTQGSQYGFLNVNGTVALGGQLVVSFVDSFQATNNNNFTVLSSTTLSGAFTNVASGNRVASTDGSGTFLVTYSGNTVVLSDFQSGPIAGAPTGTLPNENRTATSAAPAGPTRVTSDEPRSSGGKGRSITPRVTTARPGIVLQNTDQLLNLMEGTNATKSAGGVVVVHPAPAASAGKNHASIPANPGAIRPEAPSAAVVRMKPLLSRHEN